MARRPRRPHLLATVGGRALIAVMLIAALVVVGYAAAYLAAPRDQTDALPLPPDPSPVLRLPPSTSFARYVHPLVGTARYGHTFPGATVPFGMVQWSPDTQSVATRQRPVSGYFYQDQALRGFSLTHLSGAGCPTFQDVAVLPAVGTPPPPQPRGGAGAHWGWARFAHAAEDASPGYYHVRLRSGIDVTLTATSRTGLAHLAYPRTAAATLLIDGANSVNGTRAASLRLVAPDEVRGWVTSGDFCTHNRFSYTLYLDARFNRPVRRVAAWDGRALRAGVPAVAGPQAALVLGFDTRRDPVVLVRVVLSYVDAAGARRNLQAENPSGEFKRVRRAAVQAWDRLLGRIAVSGGTRTQTEVFYTALYHALLAPTVFGDVDGRYRGLDGRVRRARGYTPYTAVSGWDIYRGEAQLLALVAPRETGDMVRSLLVGARELGRLPKWLITDHALDEMVGDAADPIIADAYAFGARGFDASAALRAMVAGATKAGGAANGYVERPGLDAYLRLGYVPEQGHGLAGAVSVTLEYALDDFAIAALAQARGQTTLADLFLRRARTWRRLYNPATGYMQPRWPNGTWRPGFDPASPWLYTEGNGAQYTWFVPQDLGDLIAAMGGNTVVQRRLDRFFGVLNAGPSAPYAWMGNEPSLLVPWVYTWAGAPWRTQAVVRRAMAWLYDTGPGGLSGNDDLGTLSAWYVWAALGLYPAVPGTDLLVLHGPLFPHARVSVPGGRRFTIEGQGAGIDRPYVQAVTLDGRARRQTWLAVGAFHAGATLRVVMGSAPNPAWGTARGDAPPSFATPRPSVRYAGRTHHARLLGGWAAPCPAPCAPRLRDGAVDGGSRSSW